MALTDTQKAAALNAALSGATHIGWSTNGSTEISLSTFPRTAVTLTTATATNPAIKGNNAALTGGPSSAACSAVYFGFFTAVSGGTQLTNWNLLSTSAAVSSGGYITVSSGAISERLSG